MSHAFLSQMNDVKDAEPLVLPQTFEEFFSMHREGVYGAMWLLTRNRHEAEEIAQDAFCRVWERWEHVATLDDPEGYIYRTAMNVWRSRRRRTAVAVRRAVHAVPPDDELDRVDVQDTVLRALMSLTERQRASIVLIDLLGFTSAEAAQALGVRPSTVRVLVMRARDRLRTDLEEPS
jgi:RNA polymerase sigma-70 factor (ECF subfamily)